MTNPETGNRVRRHVIYVGRVQGVCFRAITEEISAGYDVTGYVRNLRDGTVELEAEGSAAAVDAFLAEVARHFKSNISHAQGAEVAPRHDEPDFRMRY
jgi:acylphosphatase